MTEILNGKSRQEFRSSDEHKFEQLQKEQDEIIRRAQDKKLDIERRRE